MGNELNNIVSSEYFYLETDMAFMRREAFVFDKFIIVFVEKGTARVAVGDNEYHIDSYRMLVLRPESPTRLVRSSEGFRVVLMGFMPVMLHEHTRRIEPNFFLMIYTRMAWKLTDSQRSVMEHFKELFRYASVKNGGYRRDWILSLVTSFVFGFYEMFGGLQEENLFSDSSRSRELFRNFVMLLHQNYRTQHEVQFYAGELCISAKYLTQITKRMIARTPKQIIDERLIYEATTLLVKNDSSIQEISNHLGFVDQSYFGRFFKRMMNMSPQQYRVRPKS